MYLDDNDQWDNVNVGKCVAILQASYPKFARFELHVFMDIDAPAFQEADQSKIDITHSLLQSLDGDITAYGGKYYGKLDSNAVNDLITTKTRDFYQWLQSQ